MNKSAPELIVMLTRDDRTAANAPEIFAQCRDTAAAYWGMKEEDLPFDQMKALYAEMKACGKKTVLEVVAYNEAECLAGAEMAAECGCDLLIGTVFFDSVNEFCLRHRLRYMPFVGTVTGRPSVLDGTVEGMIREARGSLAKGVYGFDLLGYRFTGDAVDLNRRFVEALDAPVCLAGSVNSFERLDEVLEASPWAFTVGSAFFEHRFGGSFAEQIDSVCAYIKRNFPKEKLL